MAPPRVSLERAVIEIDRVLRRIEVTDNEVRGAERRRVALAMALEVRQHLNARRMRQVVVVHQPIQAKLVVEVDEEARMIGVEVRVRCNRIRRDRAVGERILQYDNVGVAGQIRNRCILKMLRARNAEVRSVQQDMILAELVVGDDVRRVDDIETGELEMRPLLEILAIEDKGVVTTVPGQRVNATFACKKVITAGAEKGIPVRSADLEVLSQWTTP